MLSGISGSVRRFSTAGLPAGQRVAQWEQHNADALIGLTCRSLDERALEATEINLQLPALHLARVIAPSHLVERTPEVIRRAPSDAFACYFALAGDSFFYHGEGVRTLGPGHVVVCDADRPFVRGFSRGLEELVVKVPRETFRAATGVDSLPEPRTFDFAHGNVYGRAITRLIGSALRPRAGAPVDDAALLALLSALIGGRPGNAGAAHLAAAKTFIEDHLTDAGLTVTRIAAGVGLSERHLSRLFTVSGTSVPQYILGRRLERAYAMLSAQHGGDGDNDSRLSVGAVAAACGFGSAARFSHMFRERYDMRASDVLRAASADAAAAAASASTISKRTRDHD